ncbi:MAG: fused MFS/spermidine synthase, partial [Bacteroidia bacterium]|nr:fused MFS/spermidine synthase [Bacteroidia bacterium]
VWDKVLQKISLEGVERLLILGMGGGSSIELLRTKYHYPGKIVAVELDPVIVDIAAREFGIKKNKDLNILCMDAFVYVKKRSRAFDLVLVDLFIDHRVPDEILKPDFWTALAKKINTGGQVLFNAFEDVDQLKIISEALQAEGMSTRLYAKVNGANTVLYARK